MVPPPKKWDDESEEETSEEEETSDEEEESPAVRKTDVPIRKKFDDEEDSDDVADNWDEAEDSEEERKKTAAAAAKAKAAAEEAARNKKSKAQRIEEHREANRKKKLDGMDEDDSSEEEEDEADKRARLRQTEQDADLKHAEDLMSAGMGNMNGRTAKPIVVASKDKPGEAVDLSAMPMFKPATKPQFEALSEVLVPLLRASSAKPHYSIWLTNFCKQIAQDLPSAEIKKAASALTALSNEKMKEEKAQDKGGKKTKAAKTKVTLSAGRDVGRGAADTSAYDEEALGDEDFM